MRHRPRRCPGCGHATQETRDLLRVTRDGLLLAEVSITHGTDSGFLAVAHQDGVQLTLDPLRPAP
jgi:hypothetical protein